jgi:molybdopterin-guanine dinucleotide biosynthesis protein A
MGMRKKAAVIIAGGKSSRMKRDKALLPFGGFSTLSEYQYQRLSGYFDKIYLSAKDNKFHFLIEIIKDRYEVSSPLVAIASIFETLEVEELFVLSVDTPFVSLETIERLYQEAEVSIADVILATSPNGVEPLCAIYRRSSLPLAQEFLAKDKHRLQSFLDDLNCTTVMFENEKDFINLNHPQEYEKARLNDSLQASDESSSLQN